MNDLRTKILLELKMLDKGIFPIHTTNIWDVPTGPLPFLEGMDKEEHRKAKRKFRKLWKKAYRKYEKSEMDSPFLEKMQRACTVKRYLLEELLQELDDSHI
mgnify:CR=1 FL=1